MIVRVSLKVRIQSAISHFDGGCGSPERGSFCFSKLVQALKTSNVLVIYDILKRIRLLRSLLSRRSSRNRVYGQVIIEILVFP